MRLLAAVLVLAALQLVAGPASPAQDIPYLSGRVVDDAELLSTAARERVASALKGHETRTTNQIVLLTVPTIQGESIEEYALRAFEAWQLGRKGKDNGVLVVIAPQDRKMRIEVGYGLEGTLTDLAANRIIRNRMTPRFKVGEYDRGVEDGIAAIIAQLEGGNPPPPNDAGSASASARDSLLSGLQVPDLPLVERILLGAFIFGIIGLFTVIGVLTPGMGWFLYLFLIPFWAMFPILIVGADGTLALLITYLIGFPLAKLAFSRSAWYDRAKRDLATKGRATIGGFSLGSRSSAGSSSWSSSSSGFSGGGGRSGGGGSSGSW